MILTRLSFFYFLLLNFFTSLVFAGSGWAHYNTGDYVGMACKYSLSSTAIFCATETTSKYTCQCKDIDALGSYVYCGFSNTENSTKTQEQFIDWFQTQCPNVTTSKIEAAYKNVTNYLIDNPKKQIPNFNKSIPIYVPFKYNATLYEIAYNSYYARFRNFDVSFYFGSGLFGYWAVIILFSAIYRFLRVSGLYNSLLPSKNYTTRFIKSKIAIPSLFANKYHKTSWFKGIVPSRIESIIIFGYFVLCTLFVATRYHYVENDIIWPKRRGQMGRYPGDRSAVLTCFMSILTFLFAGRNNLLLWLTGWKYSTFVTYHKWIARMTVLMAFIHAICMLENSLGAGKYASRQQSDWWRWGCVSMVCMGIMFIQGIALLRSLHYETFLIIHILMAVFFVVGAWIHTKNFDYQCFIYTVTAIWCFDRFARYFRILVLFGGYRTATVKIVANETLRITVPYNKTTFKARPGAFAFIYFGNWRCFWQSHPFTIVTNEENNTLVFCVKFKKGCTNTIYNFLKTQPNQTAQMKVAIEGPYGSYHNLERYNDVLLYTGGNGIPGPFAYAKKLVNDSKFKGFIHLVWVIRHWESLDWFSEELKFLEQHKDKIKTSIFITKYYDYKFGDHEDLYSNIINIKKQQEEKEAYEEKQTDDSSSDNEVLTTIKNNLTHIEFKDGRPELKELVNTDIQNSSGSTVVMTCGHPEMCDDIRDIVCDAIYQRKSRIDLLDELQKW
ncbi:ferric reductase family protein SCDLUD_000072 [Saccharomycodes ludwigii]|uniref:ferric reductase family protein n=1 Tax=Saccharomycodes ludwigii TaxID=36035 RepID=UPI001E868E0B|nr:hypothetical protein SCDLUD_000072 [Saccharomycodes ludwigii]KAH3902495.1 hypothetical protein SCDLUD_000072 [Saccharomycodes ludwigii]